MYGVFKCVCLPDMSCYWPMLLGGDEEEEREHHPTMQDEGWITLERWVYLYVCVCHVPRICCRGVYCLSASYSPPPSLLSHLLLPLLITSPLPLVHFPPLLPPLHLSSSSLLPSPPSPPILPQHSWIQWIRFGHDGRPILCCTQWWSFRPSHMKMASNLVSIFGVNNCFNHNY